MRSFVTGDVLLSDSIDFQCNHVLDMLLECISDILVWSEHNPQVTCFWIRNRNISTSK